MQRSTGGFVIGADVNIDGTYRFGLAGGLTKSSLSLASRASSAGLETVFGSVYGGARFGAFDLRAGGSFGGTSYTASRTTAFPGFLDSESARYRGTTAQVFGEIGYRMDTNAAFIEPFAGAAAIRVRTNRFAEAATGGAALFGSARDHDLGTTTLGVRGEMELATLFATSLPITARAMLGWQHAFGDVTPVQSLAFAGSASSFQIAGIPVARNALVIDAGLSVSLSQSVALGVSYAGQHGSRAHDNAFKGRLDYRF